MNKFLDSVRDSVRSYMNKVASGLNRLSGERITPDMITYIGLLAHVYIAWLIAMGSLTWAGILLIIFGLFDAVDGALARIQGSTSKKGMLLDSVTDRLKEVMLYAGIAYITVVNGDAFYTVWVVAACGVSLLVSYINAWGEVVTQGNHTKQHTTNKTFRTGFMTFDVRMFTLVIGLLTGYLKQAVIFIAVFALWTALERFWLVTKKL